MSTINDGGPAFPQHAVYDETRGNAYPGQDYGAAPGMSLRDHFAGLAFAAELRIQGDVVNIAQAARFAYECADAMLAERAKVWP